MAHSEYRNQVILRRGFGNTVVVFGKESHGRYVEVVSLKTGRTVAHRKRLRP